MSFLGLRLGLSRVRSFFSPDSVSNLVLWLRSSVGVNAKTSAKFTAANSEFLSSDSADFDKGNEDFSFGGWFKVPNIAAASLLMGKYNYTSDNRSFAIGINSGTSKPIVFISNLGTSAALTQLDSSVTVANDTWFFVVAVYDSVNDLIKISTNGGAFTTAAQSTGAFVGNADLTFMARNIDGTANYYSGEVDAPFFYDKATTEAQAAALYNSGAGIAFDNLTADMLVSLVSWWEVNELTGTRVDSVVASANNLTDNNTVTSALGKIVEAVTDGDSVYQWLDQSGNSNHGVQETFASQMVYDSDTPRVSGDGTADNLNIDTVINDVSSDTAGTWACWVRPVDATPASTMGLLSFGDTDANTFLSLNVQTTGACRLVFKNAATNVISLLTDEVVFADNTWCHVGFVQNGTQSIIYINGVAVAQTDTGSSKGQWITDAAGLDNSRIGAINYASSGDALFFTGDIQQVQIYSDAKTASEIWSIYNFDKPV